MSFPLLYLVNRFLFRLKEFLRHWYVNSFWIIAGRTINFLERLDRTLALKITLRNFWRPLYQDYTFVGYILGFLFRSGRIIVAGFIYFFIALMAFCLYILWIAIPIYIIYRSI